MGRKWLRIAHRGASGSAPEHTRSAFKRALDIGVDMIELDVQLSRDDALVVMHDPELDRTTSGNGPVRAQLFAQLQRLDAGCWFSADFAGERVLSLEEVVKIVGRRARLNVEVKAPAADWPSLAGRLTEVLRAHALIESTIISCFEARALQALRMLARDARLGLLWQRPELSEMWDWARDLDVASIHPHWPLVSGDLVNAAHASGLQVLAWTVNDVQDMRDLVCLGVDGIISDFPERFDQVDGGREAP